MTFDKLLELTPASDIQDGDIVYAPTDIELAYKKMFGTAVRRNVALPSWMDDEIRNKGLDASKIFQNAIAKALRGEEV